MLHLAADKDEGCAGSARAAAAPAMALQHGEFGGSPLSAGCVSLVAVMWSEC